MNSGNMFRVAAAAALCLLGTVSVRAQGAEKAGAPGAGKIGILNVRQAIVTTAEGKQASAELQSQFAPRQNEMEALNKQINDIRQQLAANQTTWSDEQKVKAQNQGQKLAAQLDRKNTELQTDVNDAQSEVVDRIGRKMMEVLDRYSRENGFVAVFDSSAQSSPIIYASNNIDITQDIIRLYDQQYPLKGGSAPATRPAATPKPSGAPATTPKPTTPPPSKP